MTAYPYGPRRFDADALWEIIKAAPAAGQHCYRCGATGPHSHNAHLDADEHVLTQQDVHQLKTPTTED